MTIATGILVMVALTAVGTLAIAVVYAVLAHGRNWWREILSVHVLSFFGVGLAVCVTTIGIGWTAKISADEALRLAVDDIESDCDDLLSVFLHVNATEFANCLAASNSLSHAELKHLSDLCGIDEFTLVGPDGQIVETTDPGTRVGAPFFTDEARHRPYRALLDGRRLTVRQRFRPSATCTDRVLKYFAMALPAGRFLQVGYLWETFERESARFFFPIFETRLVGTSGFCVVLDEKDIVAVAVPGHPESKGRTAAEIGLTPENLSVPLGQIFRARLFGTPCRCQAYPETIANRRVIAAIPLSERQGPALGLACGVAGIIFAGYLAFRLILRKFRLQQQKIDDLRAAEEKRRAADLALAQSIQCAELRTDGTVGAGYRIATVMNAAREVGGDFYDYYELSDGRLVLTIADVSGKGVPAAFFMMKARLTLKSCVGSAPSLVEAVAEANLQLAQNNPAEMFVTAFVAIYDRASGTLEYVSAGHNPPLKVEGAEKPGKVEWLQMPRCAALGVFPTAKYRSAQTSLAAGDRLFLYTDGVTEAMNASGELFGDDRLEATLRDTLCPNVDLPKSDWEGSGLIPAVSRALASFVGTAEQSDDITMLELTLV